jgi:hypothetical protein
LLPSSRVVLVGREGCHLCEEAREVVAAVCAALGELWTEVDVDTDPAWQQRWSDLVPVVLVDGEEHARWRVDPASLRRALRS